jgi:hypothetical protein
MNELPGIILILADEATQLEGWRMEIANGDDD